MKNFKNWTKLDKTGQNWTKVILLKNLYPNF